MGMKRNLKLKLGLVCVLFLALLACVGPLLPLADPNQSDWTSRFQAPSVQHWLGLDQEGRDIFSRLLYGARLSLLVGFSTVFFSMTLGTLAGLVAGYWGGKLDELFVFLSDIFMAFPSILLIIAVAAFVPPGVLNIIVILSVVGWVSYGRIVRAQVLGVKELDYVQAARVLGISRRRILLRHILPNVLGPLIVNATLSLAGVILAESTLSFLGLGVPPGIPSWGGMLDAGTAYLLIAPHLSIVPGLAIMVTVLAFNFLGDGLRDYYDVRGKAS